MSAVALRLAGAAILLAAAMPAAAFDQTQAPANESAAADERDSTPKASTGEDGDDKGVRERKVCKRIATTGTRMGEQRVCLSREALRKAGY